MKPRLRRIALTAHVVSSVGWLGAVATSLALAVLGLTSRDPQRVRAAYLILEPLGWFVLVPLSLASLLTGLAESLVTRWGLLRHYWVVVKLLMNIVAIGVLLMYMQTLANLAGQASDPTLSRAQILALRNPSPVLHAGAALALLLVATVLAVYKPAGKTRYGWRLQNRRNQPGSAPRPSTR
jgi:hypothetical protein